MNRMEKVKTHHKQLEAFDVGGDVISNGPQRHQFGLRVKMRNQIIQIANDTLIQRS